MSNRQLLLGAQSQAKRDARREIIRLLRKLQVYGSTIEEFISLSEDMDAVRAVGQFWDVMRELRKAAKELEALSATTPPPDGDKVPDVDPPPREGAMA